MTMRKNVLCMAKSRILFKYWRGVCFEMQFIAPNSGEIGKNDPVLLQKLVRYSPLFRVDENLVSRVRRQKVLPNNPKSKMRKQENTMPRNEKSMPASRAGTGGNVNKRSKTKGSKTTQFQPGQSGNPAGRQADTSFKELAREKTIEAFQVVLDLMERGRSERVKLQAAELVLAYGHGKPRQDMGLDLTQNNNNIAEMFEAREAYLKNRTPAEKAADEAQAKIDLADAIKRNKGRKRAGMDSTGMQARMDRATERVAKWAD